MSQPIQPQQPFGQPPPQPPPMPGKPPKPKRFGFLALIITALVSLGIGGAVGGTGDGTTTALPAPTVTTTVTEPAVEGGEAPTEEPAPEPEPEPTAEAPAAWNPKPKDFKVGIKITDKQCFGSAGCNVTYKITLDYLGSQKLPAEGTTDITYEVSGAEDPIIGTITLDSEGKFDSSEESASTTSSSKKLTPKVTEVDYNEFG